MKGLHGVIEAYDIGYRWSTSEELAGVIGVAPATAAKYLTDLINMGIFLKDARSKKYVKFDPDLTLTAKERMVYDALVDVHGGYLEHDGEYTPIELLAIDTEYTTSHISHILKMLELRGVVAIDKQHLRSVFSVEVLLGIDEDEVRSHVCDNHGPHKSPRKSEVEEDGYEADEAWDRLATAMDDLYLITERLRGELAVSKREHEELQAKIKGLLGG